MLKPVIQNSKFILLSKILWNKCCYANGWVYHLYKNNHAHNKDATKIKEESNVLIFDNSKFVTWLFTRYSFWKYKIIDYFRNSAVLNLKDGIAKELYLLPIRTTSIILLSIIITNTFSSAILSKEITLLGWIIRGLFLIVGLAGLFCNINLDDIRDRIK